MTPSLLNQYLITVTLSLTATVLTTPIPAMSLSSFVILYVLLYFSE
ncbi:hypothetical protein [Methanosphaera sp.]